MYQLLQKRGSLLSILVKEKGVIFYSFLAPLTRYNLGSISNGEKLKNHLGHSMLYINTTKHGNCVTKQEVKTKKGKTKKSCLSTGCGGEIGI